MIYPEITNESTTSRQSVCLAVAVGLHALMLLWNPMMLKSDFQAAHDFVTIDVVDQVASPGAAQPEAPKSIMDTLKQMLIKPSDQLAHMAPEPVVPQVAAPVQPVLQDRTMPRLISKSFTPKTSAEDLAMANSPNTISNINKPMPSVPLGGPTLTAKSFSGIKAKDLPFQVSPNEALAGGANSIPIATGNSSAKIALNYGAPSLQDAKSKRAGLTSVPYTAKPDLSSLNASARSIPLAGTGVSGTAPTGANTGAVLENRTGSAAPGLVSKSMFGGGHMATLAGVNNIPSAAQQLDNQLTNDASSKSTAKTKQAFDISGPLNNRPIVKKVIPQYPAWAEEQGIIGSVRLYFTVTPEGTVRPNIRVTKTTGYPQLDQLGIDALKQWQFAPSKSTDQGEGEWGIITFNFSLSS